MFLSFSVHFRRHQVQRSLLIRTKTNIIDNPQYLASQCSGCGAKFHDTDETKPGYLKDYLLRAEKWVAQFEKFYGTPTKGIQPRNFLQRYFGSERKLSRLEVERMQKRAEMKSEEVKEKTRTGYLDFMKVCYKDMPERVSEALESVKNPTTIKLVPSLTKDIVFDENMENEALAELLRHRFQETTGKNYDELMEESKKNEEKRKALESMTKEEKEFQDILFEDDELKELRGEENLDVGNFVEKSENTLMFEDPVSFTFNVVTEDILKRVNKEYLKPLICTRCHTLKFKSVAIGKRSEIVNNLWTKIIGKSVKCIIVYIVDVLDFPGSFINNLYNVFPEESRVLLIGNKVDVLPEYIDQNQLRHWLKEEAQKRGLKNIDQLILTSGKENICAMKLGKEIYKMSCFFAKPENVSVFFVGSTNVGKSTLWNSIINEFDIKTSALTTCSPEPGTTVGFLKLALEHLRPKDFNESVQFPANGFVYDTPGINNPHSFSNVLKLKEIEMISLKEKIVPVSWRVKQGQSLFIGGLVRLDYVSGTEPIFITMMVSKNVIGHLVETTNANDEYEKMAGDESRKTKYLLPPLGGKERMKDFPPLQKAMTIKPNCSQMRIPISDFVFSGLGWVCFTSAGAKNVTIDVFTPNGIKPYEREPFYLEAAIHGMSGYKKGKENYYKTDKLSIAEIEHVEKNAARFIYLKEKSKFTKKKRALLKETLDTLKTDKKYKDFSYHELAEEAESIDLKPPSLQEITLARAKIVHEKINKRKEELEKFKNSKQQYFDPPNEETEELNTQEVANDV
ncbi:hypothetical protein ROZALSC1DRAFT_27896 [Rozella allomycis CSF55]|uniref:G domain-containing protein n=1 Tax=Rozella allomycis (strain CSF55) TaxID=988480 RepID=A0A4P9YLU1_ROZAC|nr:hypothetical protein ROZALSC1DRAFT_27896 [Rozella allomycis CSF55]